jgi:hypothetical protein
VSKKPTQKGIEPGTNCLEQVLVTWKRILHLYNLENLDCKIWRNQASKVVYLEAYQQEIHPYFAAIL